MPTDVFDQLAAADGHAQETVDEQMPRPQNSAESCKDYTPVEIKQCVQELLKSGLLEMERKPNLYQTAVTYQEGIRQLLEPFDLRLQIDDVRGLAFLSVAEAAIAETQDDEWTHPLVRRQRLTLEQSLLVAILRKRFLNHEQENGAGAGDAVLFVDDLIPELQIYLNELGSDVKEQSRVRNLLEKLKGHGIVSQIDDKDQITIRPIIAHLASPESLRALLEQYKRLANAGREGP
ncbi:DUF4194 domain-containing protein [Thiolapillus sp.]